MKKLSNVKDPIKQKITLINKKILFDLLWYFIKKINVNKEKIRTRLNPKL